MTIRHRFRLVALLSAAPLLAACGNKGDLVMPPPKPAPAQPATPAPPPPAPPAAQDVPAHE